MTLNPGDTLSHGQYHIQRLLGQGRFGSMYVAEDTLLGETVAIQELVPALVGDDKDLQRLLEGAQAAQRLVHPHIVRTRTVFAEAGNHYVVTEFMPGGSLEDWLASHAPLPVDEVVRIAVQVCEGLEHAHEQGIVHGNLKPAHILFAADPQAAQGSAADVARALGADLVEVGAATIADAGAAKVAGVGVAAGTVDEAGDDPQADVYALGVVLYRMLTGQIDLGPAERDVARTEADAPQGIQQQQPDPPSYYNPLVPAWLDQVVLKALARPPEQGYASLAALRAALLEGMAPWLGVSQADASAPASSPPISPPRARAATRARRTLPAWLWPAVGAGVALLVGLAAALVMLWPGQGPGRTGLASPTTAALGTRRATATTALMLTPARTATPLQSPTAAPVSSPGVGPAATESVAGTIPALDATLTELRFFEAGDDVPPFEERVYARRFAAITSRYIYYEVNLSHPAPGKRLPFEIKAVYIKPDGEVLGRTSQETRLEADWTWSWHTKGWGWDDAGHWPPGEYTVEIWVDDELVARDAFVID